MPTHTASASNGGPKGPTMSKLPTTPEKKRPPVHQGWILLEDVKDEGIGINGLAQAIR